MANDPHSGLTGSDLHEPKGVAAASASKVYVSDGAGSGSWQTVPVAALAAPAKAFQAQLLHITEEQTSNVAAGSFVSGDYRTRALNTTRTNDLGSGAALSGNQIALAAGTYYIEASAPAVEVNGHKIRWYNVTDASATLQGTAELAVNPGQYGSSRSHVSGRFTIAGAKTFELQHVCQSSSSSANGMGYPVSFSGNEVYADVKIWKTA